MATRVNEINTYFGRCRCCLDYTYLKNLWSVHLWEGDNEVYGQMITDCFALTLEKPSSVEEEQICETCINRLRDAWNFKCTVIKSQEQLMNEVSQEVDTLDIKIENVKEENIVDDEQMSDEHQDMLKKHMEIASTKIDDEDCVNIVVDTPYEDIEYLEEEVLHETIKTCDDPTPIDSDGSGPSKGKWPKKLPRDERNKKYLQYTEEDLRKGIEAVKNQKMSRLEAAEYYNVPRKTLASRLKMDEERAESDPIRDEMYKFLMEIKTILTFTNVTPFKTRLTSYCCAYCNDVVFNEAVDLRNHTRACHMDDRTKRVDLMMRPHWMNEVLKVDIHNLLCVLCCTPLNNWSDMFKHLKDNHQVQLDLAYRRVIPYNLGTELKCVHCKQSFMNFLQVDGHMNTHYDNYICIHCGDTFLAAMRLKSHMKIHIIGRYPCNECGKVFNKDHYRKKHESIVHKKSLHYRCVYCAMRFVTDTERKNHITEVHSDKIKIITCDQCGKTFNWRHYFLSHVRKTHSGKQYECPHCEKRFIHKKDLDGHLAAKHDGEKKYNCPLCGKKYSSRPGLVRHLKMHEYREEQVT